MQGASFHYLHIIFSWYFLKFIGYFWYFSYILLINSHFNISLNSNLTFEHTSVTCEIRALAILFLFVYGMSSLPLSSCLNVGYFTNLILFFSIYRIELSTGFSFNAPVAAWLESEVECRVLSLQNIWKDSKKKGKHS